MNDQSDQPNSIPVDMSAFDVTPLNISALGNILPDNAVLALFPPRIPRATEPVAGAHYGVPLRIYDLEPMGLGVHVDPPLGLQPGDVITLNLNGQPDLGGKTIQPGEENATSTLYLPKKLLQPDFINRLTYTVTRGSQNMGTSEPPLEILYNAIRPGNVDRDPGVDGHSELELILPDVIKNGVGPDFPAAGAQVCVSYPYCRAFDRIWLNCNGFAVYHTVTPLEAPQPGSATPVTVCFSVTRADLASAGDHLQFTFSYTVTDQLGNNPDPNSPWSASEIVDVDLAGNRLPEPILREIQNDPADDPSIIDLEKLGSNPLLVIVLTNDPRFRPGDSLNATYTATLPGQADVVVPATGIVEADEFGQKKPCILQVQNDKVPANSVVRVSYQLIRGGVTIATSRTTKARVIGEGLPTLQAPRLIKSVKGVLDPLDPANLQGANGQVEVLGYRAGDTVQLIVKGAPGAGSPTFAAKPLNVNSRANFPLSKAFIAANMGKTVEFSYVLIRGGKSFPSPALTASVGTIPDSHPNLPTPAMDGAIGNVLDVTNMQASDQLRVGEWPQQVSGQTVWLRYDGVDANGAAIVFEDRKGEPHTTLPGLSRPAPIEWLKTLKDGSVLTISFKVSFDGVANEATAVSFPVRTYTVVAVTELVVDISPVLLNGINVTVEPGVNWKLSGKYPAGTTQQRTATGGKPPYTYLSMNPDIAIVLADGLIISQSNGVTAIVVKDSSGQEQRIPVTSQNNFSLRIVDTGSPNTTFDQAVGMMNAVRGQPLLSPGVQALWAKYAFASSPPPLGAYYLWTCDPGQLHSDLTYPPHARLTGIIWLWHSLSDRAVYGGMCTHMRQYLGGGLEKLNGAIFLIAR